MREKKDHYRDLAEIRLMMERSSKFLSLSGWAGILAGLFALTGAYVAFSEFNFYPDRFYYPSGEYPVSSMRLLETGLLALIILAFSITTAVLLSLRKARGKGERLWNSTSRRLLANMAAPLLSGAALTLLLIFKGFIGLAIPLTLLFYGLALFNAGNFTVLEVRILAFVELTLAILSAYFVEESLLFWAIGFGVAHIVYGLYMRLRYQM